MRKALKILIPLLIILTATYMGIVTLNRYFPLHYQDIIRHYARVHNVDPVLMTSIINIESRFNRFAVSPAGASGLMQIMEPTAIWIAERMGIENFDYQTMIFDPEVNINMGTWYIRHLMEMHYNLDVALAAYNAGMGNVANWLQNPEFSSDGKTLDYIPFRETRNYVERVNLSMRVYRFLMR